MDATPEQPASRRIRGDDLLRAGLEPGPVFGVALRVIPRAVKRLGRDGALAELTRVVADPAAGVEHEFFAELAAALQRARRVQEAAFVEREEPAPYASWCGDADDAALAQMRTAMRIPSAVRGALMPDAHLGYGLPIGGVLATAGTVIPYAVGVDIACRMKLSVLDLAPSMLDAATGELERVLLEETSFGIGTSRAGPADADVMDGNRWNTRLLRGLRDRAAAQLGTSGSGNHFVEFGSLTLSQPDLGLAAGDYLAVLSHSGSRGAGARVADHYSKLARSLNPTLPKELSYLAWLPLESEPGQEYWHAMNLMGEYASASHAAIHERIASRLRATTLAGVENHHNFAWPEQHDGRELIVHRKGATPADEGVLGVIPGSMAAPGFVVRGRGNAASLSSASHGAGRAMSRMAARRRFTWKQIAPLLEQAGVRLLAAGIDENPLAYKDINAVMAQQTDLVEIVARFKPRIVRMADSGERPED